MEYATSRKPWVLQRTLIINNSSETHYCVSNGYTHESAIIDQPRYLKMVFDEVIDITRGHYEEKIDRKRFNTITSFNAHKLPETPYLYIGDISFNPHAQLTEDRRYLARFIDRHIIMDMSTGKVTKVEPRRLKELKDLGLIIPDDIIRCYNEPTTTIELKFNMPMKESIGFMQMAKDISQFATCDRRHVGAIILSAGGTFLSAGFNTAPKGKKTCDEVGHLLVGNSCKRTIHAEMNAIKKALRNGYDLEGCIMYVTHQPCNECAKHISDVGIKWVVYDEEYPQSYDNQLDHLTVFIPYSRIVDINKMVK